MCLSRLPGGTVNLRPVAVPRQALTLEAEGEVIPLKECLEAVGGVEGAFYKAQKN